MDLVGPMNLAAGNLYSSGPITGTGVLSLTGSGGQVQASSVGISVTGGAINTSPITAFDSPSSPTPSPLPANSLPNPDPATMLALVSQTNPVGTCAGGNLVIDLGTSVPPQVFQFTGTPYTTACGTTLDVRSIPANVSFTGTGTLWFSGPSSGKISFYNNFGTVDSNNPALSVASNINIIARPLSAATVGSTELEFRGQYNNFAGLIYTQGAVESEGPVGPSCTVPPNYFFNVSGTVIAFGNGTNQGVFDTEHCSNVNLTYNPSWFTSNPPPGFNGLLSTGIKRTAVINWHDVSY
jgi:hypothetical protein